MHTYFSDHDHYPYMYLVSVLFTYRPFTRVGGMECLHQIIMSCARGSVIATPLGGKEFEVRTATDSISETSEYCKGLDPVSKKRYLEKLKLSEDGDPYAPDNATKFMDDMSKWPPVEFGHIFCYNIECPGVYTRCQLMQWKSLEAYNYFQSDHVRAVKVWCLPAF